MEQSDNINCSTMAVNVSSNNSCPWLEEFRDRESALIERWKKGGIFVDSDLEDINCYWFQFDPVPLTSHLILAFIFFAISGVGSASNALVFYIMATSKHLRTPVNIIIANLALSDFIMLVKMPIFIYNSLVQGPALGYRGCEIYGFFSGIAGCSSIMSLAAIAFDRYLVINRPYKGNNTSKASLVRSYITVVCIWLYSGVISSLPLFGIGKYVPEGYLTSCSFDYLSDDPTTQNFILAFFIVAWVIPVSIIIGSYSAVLRFVSQNRHLVSRAVEIISGTTAEQQLDIIQEGHQESRAARSQRKAAKFEMIIAKVTAKLVALWMVSWTPYAIVALLGITGHQNLLTPSIAMLPALFAKSSATINPFVFSLNHPKIRKEIIRRFRCVTAVNTHSTTAAAGDNNRMDAVDADGHPATNRQRNHQQDLLGSPLLQFRSRVFSSRTDCSSPSEPMSTTRHYPSRAISSSLYGCAAPTGNISAPSSDDPGAASVASANSSGLGVRPKKSVTPKTCKPSSESTSVRIESRPNLHSNGINGDAPQRRHNSQLRKKKSRRSHRSLDLNIAVQFHSAGHLSTVTLGHNGGTVNLNHVDEIRIDGNPDVELESAAL